MLQSTGIFPHDQAFSHTILDQKATTATPELARRNHEHRRLETRGNPIEGAGGREAIACEYRVSSVTVTTTRADTHKTPAAAGETSRVFYRFLLLDVVQTRPAAKRGQYRTSSPPPICPWPRREQSWRQKNGESREQGGQCEGGLVCTGGRLFFARGPFGSLCGKRDGACTKAEGRWGPVSTPSRAQKLRCSSAHVGTA